MAVALAMVLVGGFNVVSGFNGIRRGTYAAPRLTSAHGTVDYHRNTRPFAWGCSIMAWSVVGVGMGLCGIWIFALIKPADWVAFAALTSASAFAAAALKQRSGLAARLAGAAQRDAARAEDPGAPYRASAATAPPAIELEHQRGREMRTLRRLALLAGASVLWDAGSTAVSRREPAIVSLVIAGIGALVVAATLWTVRRSSH